MRISVVITTFNRPKTVARTLETLFAQEFPSSDYEIVVVVDGSTDGTAAMLRGLQAPCTLSIIEQPNRGQGEARRVAVAAARGELVLFLDDDMLCGRRLLAEHCAAHLAPEDRVVLGPVFFSPESRRSVAAELACRSAHQFQPQPAFPDDAMTASNSSVRRSTLLAMPVFDPQFSRYLQDIDTGMTLWKAGIAFHYEPNAVTHHLYVKTAGEMVRSAWMQGSYDVRLSRKHPEYRPVCSAARLCEGPLWKRVARQAVARAPWSVEPLLRAPFWLVERLRFLPLLDRAARGMLRARIGIAGVRGVVAEAGSWKQASSEFGARLPALLYHHVGPVRPDACRPLTTPPELFARHIRWLAQQGYAGVRLSDWLAWRREGRPLLARPLLITFDRAYADIARHALPVLKAYGFGAAVFVITSQLWGGRGCDHSGAHDGVPLMSAQQIRQWAGEGVEFGTHGRRHRDLCTLSQRELDEELEGSQIDLKNLLDRPAIALAYPWGRFNQTVLNRTKRAYQAAFGHNPGVNCLGTDSYGLRRVPCSGRPLFALASWLKLGCGPFLLA